LEEIMAGLPRQQHPDLLVGLETADDAGVYRLTPEIALIQTVDFFTPIVNDPYLFGQIAAANALSDVYAMGGKPLTAMNILCVSFKMVPKQDLKAILAGGLDKIHQAGALLVGGHSVEDVELKYGLSVTGVVHPDRVLSNAGARLGDSLILTKPLGTGVIATASKGRLASVAIEAQVAEIMRTLNRIPEDILAAGHIHAATDITGFGFFGHALEMARGSRMVMTFYASRIPLLAAAREFAQMGMVPAGSFANRRFCESHVQIAPSLDPLLSDLFSDAQTNGGLLLSVAPTAASDIVARFQESGLAAAAMVGEVTAPGEGSIRLEP
jgi:selenide, water dikinase